ncbi:MAG: energy-coupling factor transporter transmembrane protein EcfT [Chloroflexi bacterium]|nr:energy-coupling factor transporter transmembrane protein EcfT [Chloroflexota bacterium]
MQGAVIPITMVSGNSVMHRINPIPKLAWAVGVLAISFATRNPAILGTIFVLGVILVLISGIGKAYLRVVMILFPISLTLIVMQSIAPAFPKPWTPIVPIGPFTIYQEGIYSGITMLLRIMAMTTFALVFIMTSHPSDIFTSLQKIGMPYVLNFILTMTLQLIPILQNEFTVVLNAQKSRGMKGTGFGAILPSMVPVFVGAIERVQQLSISLESRAYGSKGNKTSYRQVAMNLRDYLVMIGAFVASGLTLYWIIVDKSLDWSKTFAPNPTVSIIIFTFAAIGFAVFMIFAVRSVLKA